MQASLEGHNESFSTLLGLIPAKHYLAREEMLYGGNPDLDDEDVRLFDTSDSYSTILTLYRRLHDKAN